MAHINLLPWRDERRKQRERDFYAKLGMTFVVAILVVIVLAVWNNARINTQNERNNYLRNQIRQVQSKINKIKNLEKVRDQLLARKKIIEQLQSNRSQMVHLFDELVKAMPDSVRLTSMNERDQLVKKTNTLVKHLTLKGVAQSNSSVSEYMTNLAASPWFTEPHLQVTHNQHGDSRMPYTFGLTVTLSTPSEKQIEEARKAAIEAKRELAPGQAASVAGAAAAASVARPAEPVAPAPEPSAGKTGSTPPAAKGGRS